MQQPGDRVGTDAPPPSAELDEGAPFTLVLLDDDRERAYTAATLLARLAGPKVRVVRVGNSLQPRLMLERILVQVAGPEGEVFSGNEARLLVRALAERQGQETRVVLVIDEAETLPPKVLRSLQTMMPYFAQEGQAALQVVFVGRPAFRALLAGEEMAPLREALGTQADLAVPKVAPAPRVAPPDAPVAPGSATVAVSHTPPPAGSGSNGMRVPAPAAPPRAAPPSIAHGRAERLEPTLAWPPVPPPKPSAAEPAMTPGPTPRRGRVLGRLLLALAILAGLAWAAYSGLHELFYRDLPARPLLSAVVPATPEPLPAPPPSVPLAPVASNPVPSTPVPSTPVPPPPAAPAPSAALAPPPAEPAIVAPPVVAPPVAPAPQTDQAARLRRDFDAFLAGSGRNAAALSETQRSALFDEFLAWRSHNAAPSATPATPAPRIVIHVPAGSAAADALTARLLASLGARPGTVEARRVAETPHQPSIRYFYPEDAPAARQVATWMADTGLTWALQDFSTFQPRPSRGTIEVWLPRQP